MKVSLEIKEMMESPKEDAENLEQGPSEPTDKAILVLNTKPFAAKPLVFDLNGKISIERRRNNMSLIFRKFQ